MEVIGVHGLVLREVYVGDHDKILTLLTKERGLMTVTGKGVRSLKNRNVVACQPFTYSYYHIRKSNKYYYVSETETIENFFDVKGDIDKLSLAAYLCDVVAELSVEGMPDPDLLRLTLNCLYALDRNLHSRPQIKAAFEMRAAAISGFLPDLSTCGRCLCDPKGDMYLDIMNGRILCRDCKPIAEAEEISSESGTARLYFLISETVFYAMRFIVSAPAERFLSFSIDKDELHLLGKVTEAYLCNHIERSFHTLDFYKKILLEE